MTADAEGKGPLGSVVTMPSVPKVLSSWPLGVKRATPKNCGASMAVCAVPATTISPFDCSATALGLQMPLAKNDAIVVPISVPSDVYRTRPITSPLGLESPSLLKPVTTAMSPLDCSIAVKVLRFWPMLVVTIPPVPKVVSSRLRKKSFGQESAKNKSRTIAPGAQEGSRVMVLCHRKYPQFRPDPPFSAAC